MFRVNTSVQVDEVAFVRKDDTPFLILYNPQTQPLVDPADQGSFAFSQVGQDTLFVRNIGTKAATFQIRGAQRSYPVEKDEDEAEFTNIGPERTVVGGGLISIDLNHGQFNVIELVATENSLASVRVQLNSFSPWTVWKADDQQDRELLSEESEPQ